MSSLVIGGTMTSFVQEDFAVTGGNIATVGGLTISGGQGQASFAPQSGTPGIYGTFTLASNGVWTYTADNSQAAIQVLGNGDFLTDSVTAVSSDGTASQLVTVTILGANDVPTIGGVSASEVTEDVAVSDGNLTTGGTLTISDPDRGQSSFMARSIVGGSFGTFSIAADGTWTYTADDSRASIQALDAGQSLTDSFRAISSDGSTSQLVTVTINGTHDVPVIGGTTTGSVTEDFTLADGSLSTFGILTITDPDADAQLRFTPRSNVAGTYGRFTLTPTGVWTYTADDSQTAIQQLGHGQSLTDSFTAVSTDGLASQLVTVTINGTNDDPVIGGISRGAVTEDTNLVGSSLTTSGTLTIADADQGQSSYAPRSNVAGTYGTFSLTADGVWTYTADDDQTAIQQLRSGQPLTDSFWAVSSDGSGEAYVMVTIIGTNDVPVIGGVSTGSVTADANLAGTNLTTSGTLTIADVDQGQSSFAQPFRTGTYGVFTLGTNGAWTYAVNNSSPAIQQLGGSQSITDSFVAISSDGTASQAVTVTINGTADTFGSSVDFNGDGRADILWRNGSSGLFTEWQSSGNSFNPNVYVNGTVNTTWHIAGLADFNGDGRSDVIFRNDTGLFTEWQSTGNGFSPNIYVDAGVSPSWHLIATADFSGDGRADLLWRNTSGTFTEWQSTGNGFNQNTYVNVSVDPSWQVIATADFNGDGRSDLLWRNRTNGTFTEWQSTGTGFTPNVYVNGSVDPSWQLAATGDFNGDSLADLLWRNTNGTFTEWQSTTNGFMPNTYVNSSVNPSWHIAAAADFDGDHNADILWRNDTQQTTTVWSSSGSGFTPNTYIDNTVSSAWTVQPPH
jgi:VCBS repeat-containing protein